MPKPISDKQVKQNYQKCRAICERINASLRNGYLVFDDEGNRVDPKYEFCFNETDWENLGEHVWFEEITKKSSETSTTGYFDPDQPWKDAKAYWSKWWAIPLSPTIRFVE